MKGVFKFISVLIAICLGVAACATASASSTALSVELRDFSFAPDTYTIPTGKEITLNLTNKGANVHEFVIMKGGTKVTPPFDDDDEGNIYWELDDVAAGTSKSDKFTAPAPGTYQIVCGTPGHIEQGMIGTLTVTQ
jgi:uncharacterized cupredoxin-like copper-binding protein